MFDKVRTMRISLSIPTLAAIMMIPGVASAGVEVSEDELRMFIQWHAEDPVSQEERDRDAKVKAVQGNGNPWVQ